MGTARHRVCVVAVLAVLAGCSAFGADTSGGGNAEPPDGSAEGGGNLEGGRPGQDGGDAAAGGDSGDAATSDCALSLDVSTAPPAGWAPVFVSGGNEAAGTNNGRPSIRVTATTTSAQATLSHALTSMPSSIEIDAFVAAPTSAPSAGGTLIALDCTQPTVSLHVFFDGLKGLALAASPLGPSSYSSFGPLYYDAYHTFRFTFSGTTAQASVDGVGAFTVTGTMPFTGAAGCTLTIGANLAGTSSPSTPVTVDYARLCVR